MDSRPSPARAGFTLIEVMAAVAIVSIVLISVLAIRTRNVRDAVLARNARQAFILANGIMESSLIGEEPEVREDLPSDFTWSVSTMLQEVGDEEEVVQVTVEVTFPGVDSEKTILLTSYRLIFEGEEFEDPGGGY